MNVATDPDLSPAERETVIQWAADEDTLLVFTEMPAVARWLLAHPETSTVWTRGTKDEIYAVKARLTVGALKLSGNPRQDTTPSSVTGKLPEGDK